VLNLKRYPRLDWVHQRLLTRPRGAFLRRCATSLPGVNGNSLNTLPQSTWPLPGVPIALTAWRWRVLASPGKGPKSSDQQSCLGNLHVEVAARVEVRKATGTNLGASCCVLTPASTDRVPAQPPCDHLFAPKHHRRTEVSAQQVTGESRTADRRTAGRATCRMPYASRHINSAAASRSARTGP